MTLLQRDRKNISLGREEGREEQRLRMSALTDILLRENLIDELKRAVSDGKYLEELFEKYGI